VGEKNRSKKRGGCGHCIFSTRKIPQRERGRLKKEGAVAAQARSSQGKSWAKKKKKGRGKLSRCDAAPGVGESRNRKKSHSAMRGTFGKGKELNREKREEKKEVNKSLS